MKVDSELLAIDPTGGELTKVRAILTNIVAWIGYDRDGNSGIVF